MTGKIAYRLKPTRMDWRVIFLLVLVACAGVLAISYWTDPARGIAGEYAAQAGTPVDERPQIVGERENVTVATGMDSPFSNTKGLYAFGEEGRLIFYSNRTVYGDVDPTNQSDRVLVAGHDYFRDANPGCSAKCTTQNITYVNLTTGEHERIYSYTTPGYRNTNWHDVDHLGGDYYMIAGMIDDDAWIVNVSTGIRTWQWDAQSAFPIGEAGPFPGDWAHLNDVEVIDAPTEPGEWYMFSLRNQDQVVFVDPQTGVIEDWTLGCEDCHDILFEQHNPDYIPPERGGPAVVVADSENNRVVEYQRTNGTWTQTWVWQDERMSWPRDADRLPNGHTLITDAHGNRVLEVNRSGTIVWQARVVNGYDAERLGTGDESAGGPSATKAGLESRYVGTHSLGKQTNTDLANEQEWNAAGWITKLWHVAQFVFPVWVGVKDVAVAGFGAVTTVVWGVAELYWRGYRLRRPLAKRARNASETEDSDTTPADD